MPDQILSEMAIFESPDFDAHEQVVFACDPAAGLRAIIAIHDTTLGPALGGCRIWKYTSEGAAVRDALRLSAGMSHKAALAGLDLGGGKAVIMADSRTEKTPAMMRAFGRTVERLAGRYITAEDVGCAVADMDAVGEETEHVAGVSGGAGDPSPFTARGVFLSMQEAVKRRLGRSLEGVRVSVKGLGNVGEQLCRQLHAAGAEIVVSDIRADAVAAAQADLGCGSVPVEEAAFIECDVFAPCALGAELNAESIPKIRAGIVCGAANNLLSTPADDARVAEAGILYCPDYLVNAGGLISVARRTLSLSEAQVNAKVDEIPATLGRIIDEAAATGKPTGAVADAHARARFRG